MRGYRGILLLAAVGACGGTAIIDPLDDDGAGGTGTGTTTGTGTGTSTGSPALEQPCDDACDQLLSCVTLSENCKQGCSAPAGSCEQDKIAMLACYQQALDDSCTDPDVSACADARTAYLTCRNATQTAGDCEAPAPFQCNCSISLQSGEVYASECGGTTCDCFADGDYVGTCLQDPNTADVCVSSTSCCDAVLFIAAPP
jgi:hypothetical protein